MELADYINELLVLKEGAKNNFRSSFEELKFITIEQRLSKLDAKIEPFKTFNDAKEKIEDINKYLCSLENEIRASASIDIDKANKLFKPINESVKEIIIHYEKGIELIKNEIRRLFEKLKECLQGRKEDGKKFQDLILEFFDIMFIHELDRFRYSDELKSDLRKKYKGIWMEVFRRMDGFYIKRDSFDAKKRTGFEFKELIVECKNKKPDINDLMQCFRYTLYFQTTELSKVPLTLLIGRDSPAKNSSIWDINKKIFDKQIANETRLILILGIDDLEKMKDIKIDGGDPAKIIKDKIDEWV